MKSVALFLTLATLYVSSLLHAMPSQILILRHAEKLENGNTLSTRGQERAAALAPYLAETNSFLTYGSPVAIYAMAAPNGDSSLGPIETVTPLANRLKLTLIDTYERDNYKKMAEEIKKNPAYHGKNIVICWEHAVIPELARAFGALQTPSKWTSDIYDRIWLITFAASGKATFQHIPQRLLYSDSQN